jgi:hypothetical protein
MCTLVQNQVHGRNQRQGPEPSQYSDFKDFLDMKPPVFKEVDEPL